MVSRAKLVDFETKLAAIEDGGIAAVALAHDVDLMGAMAEIDPRRQRERRGQHFARCARAVHGDW